MSSGSRDLTQLDHRDAARVRQLFHEVCELPADERAAYLDRACISAPHVRAEVESLLRSMDEAGDFIEPRSRDSHRTFRQGDRIAGRYRVAGLLGEGGMGEVYEAHDEELDESVALKIIRPEYARNPRILQRFKREIQLARRITHPNVCRIFDVSHHLTSGASNDDQGRIAFVSMELLRGETLSEHLRRSGRLTPAQALPIIEQMVAGLGAAHASGVVHRDFKSANVMIAGASATPRVVVTDFGLAFDIAQEGDVRSSLTEPGVVMGTPDYMAPEQVEGLAVTPATDVYALGIVMFEMLTGKLPFTGVTPMAVALSRLRERPPSPRQSVPNLDPRWEAVVLRCLERDPSARFQDVHDVVRALGGVPVKAVRRNSNRTGTAIVMIVAGLCVAGAIIATRVMNDDASSSTQPAKSVRATVAQPVVTRPSFAVLGFHNLSGDAHSEWIGNAFAEMLTTELSAGEALRAVPGERVEQVKADLGLTSGSPIPANRLSLVRSSLASDLLVSGAFLALPAPNGNRIRLDVRVQDARSGELRTTLSESGVESDMIELANRVGGRLRVTLGSNASGAQLAGLRAAVPTDERVAREYAEGMARLRQFDPRAARPFFERAIAIDPKYPLAHSALAQTLWTLGYENDARTAARRALDLATSLEREKRLDIEGRFYEYTKDWERATNIMRSLHTFFPDDVDYGLRLAVVQSNAGKGDDALKTLAELRKLPSPLGDDPRIDLVEADTANSLPDYPRELAAAERARVRGEALGARLIVARAHMNRGFALRQTAKSADALAAIRQAREIFRAAGDDAATARAATNAALILADMGELKEAEREYATALEIQRTLGNQNARSLTLVNVANLHAVKGDLTRAIATVREALALAREAKNGRLVAAATVALGTYQQLAGDMDGAQRSYEETIPLADAASARGPKLDALTNLAEVHRLRGNLPAARARTDQALALARELKVPRLAAYILAGAAQISLLEGKLDLAKRDQEAAVAMYDKLGQKNSVAEQRLGLAAIELARNDLAAADRAASAAAAQFESSGMRDFAALAHLLHARALLQSGKADDAQREIDGSAASASKSSNPEVQIAHDVARARLLLSRSNASNAAEARKLALRAAQKARKAMLAPAEFEARIAAAESTVLI
nr:protein kinase [Acidobacteriota bacterium]